MSDKCRSTRKSAKAIYHEQMYRRSDGFSCKTRIKNQYILVFLIGSRVVVMSAFVAGAATGVTGTMRAVFETKQYMHNKPKL